MGEVDSHSLRLSDSFRKAYGLAYETSELFKHNYVGTEHLLLGALKVPTDEASEIEDLEIDREDVYSKVEVVIHRGDKPVSGDRQLTPRARKVVELASAEAREDFSDEVNLTHLMRGLVREGEGIAAGILENLGVNYEKLYALGEENRHANIRHYIDQGMRAMRHVLENPDTTDDRRDALRQLLSRILNPDFEPNSPLR